MKAADHLQVLECVINEVKVTLSEKERKTYDSMCSELVVSLGGEEINAGNAAALANKLSQMANGAVYLCGETWEEITVSLYHNRQWVFRLHDKALDEVQKILDSGEKSH